eukprot:7383004-Prymnesium_polylepis.2
MSTGRVSYAARGVKTSWRLPRSRGVGRVIGEGEGEGTCGGDTEEGHAWCGRSRDSRRRVRSAGAAGVR